MGFNTDIHPIGDLLFNPLAQPHSCHRFRPQPLPDHSVGGGCDQFRLFRNDGSSKLATSNNFTVTSGSTTLSTSPSTVAAGNPVTSTWSGIMGAAARDSIGV